MEVFLHPDDADGDEKSLHFRDWNHWRCFQFTDFSYWVLYVTFDVRQDSAFGCAAFSETFCDQRRDGRKKWPQSTAAGARGDGKGRQVSCLPSSRWPPGRRGCGTRRRCDRASLRTRLRSRREFPNSPLEVKSFSPAEGSPRASPTRGRARLRRGRWRTRRPPRIPVSASGALTPPFPPFPDQTGATPTTADRRVAKAEMLRRDMDWSSDDALTPAPKTYARDFYYDSDDDSPAPKATPPARPSAPGAPP